MRVPAVALAGSVAVILCACVPAPTPLPTTTTVPPSVQPSTTTSTQASTTTSIKLLANSPERAVRALTLRVRAFGCGEGGTGSGFAVASRLLVTNRHVVEYASTVQLDTWDGRSVSTTLTAIAEYSDLALVMVDADLPAVGRLAEFDPLPGDQVVAVGYPLGGEPEMSPGTIIDYAPGQSLGTPGNVMRLTASIQPGNSGGPVLNDDLEVVGVIYAIEISTGDALAMPVSVLKALINQDPTNLRPPHC